MASAPMTAHGFYAGVLERPPLRIDLAATRSALHGRTVLLTGAGGSIGSAVTRAILGGSDARLILLDSSERAVERLSLSLRAGAGGEGRVSLVLGDLLDQGLLERLLAKHRPDVVIHAAAFKRVPLLESHPLAALRNNLHGTRVLLRALQHAPEPTFVLVSTDKAVRPASVLGASKRLGELSVLGLSGPQASRSSCVRLCNVLDSSGSVFPRFRKQALAGEPLTVSDPAATRHLVTRHEAAEIVLASLTHCHGRDILVPQPGDAVSVMRMARVALAAAGRAPRDDDILTTGLRCGEKLHEELLEPSEHAVPTRSPALVRVVGPVPEPRTADVVLSGMEAALDEGDLVRLAALLCEALPDYIPGPTAQRALGVILPPRP